VRVPSGLSLRNYTLELHPLVVIGFANPRLKLSANWRSSNSFLFMVIVALARDSPLLNSITDVPFLPSAPGAIVLP